MSGGGDCETVNGAETTHQRHHVNVCQFLHILLSALLPAVSLSATIRGFLCRLGGSHLVTD